ncbi:Unknown protein sequence [Pseudomonas syringae pv. maculicola]|nr:Unknown protein sequence [Pseudomonas syringae pv. maculicola]
MLHNCEHPDFQKNADKNAPPESINKNSCRNSDKKEQKV